MMDTLKSSASAPIEVSSYKTPAVNLVDVTSEGVLCSSFEQYDEDVLEW